MFKTLLRALVPADSVESACAQNKPRIELKRRRLLYGILKMSNSAALEMENHAR